MTMTTVAVNAGESTTRARLFLIARSLPNGSEVEPADRTARRLAQSGSDELPLRVVLALELRLLGLALVHDLGHARLFVRAPLLLEELPFLPSQGMAHAALTSSPKQ
jgi:hypothetical protein